MRREGRREGRGGQPNTFCYETKPEERDSEKGGELSFHLQRESS